MTIAWPMGVESRPVQGSLKATGFRAPLHTDMDDGNQRSRRSSTKSMSTLAFNIEMLPSEFDTFRAWARDTLVDGTLPFTMSVWTGSTYATKTCHFTQPYTEDPGAGFIVTVGVSIDVEDR